MRVRLPSPLDGYTGGVREVEAEGGTLAEVLDALDARWPGVRFRLVDEQGRVRRHITLFVDGERADDLSRPTAAASEVMIVAALSGG